MSPERGLKPYLREQPGAFERFCAGCEALIAPVLPVFIGVVIGYFLGCISCAIRGA